ncbi:hypothetical protein DZC78_00365 [Olleya aquimaris]|nr:hypothetical protein DZC78_00365 [Olleya aquimaris]
MVISKNRIKNWFLNFKVYKSKGFFIRFLQYKTKKQHATYLKVLCCFSTNQPLSKRVDIWFVLH